jgi:RHS repeat-associated protein
MKGMQITRNPLNFNKYQFLNREIQIETGLVDLMNRQYDPQRGQFTSIDALSELSRRFSPTVYGNDNPVLMIDPDGMRAVWNGKYGDDSGYNDDESGESRSWGEVQGEYGIGDDDKDKGKKDKDGNTNFNGGYKDKDGNSHYYPSMDVTMTMSDEGRETYNKAALKETAFAIIPWGRMLRFFGLNRVSSFLFGRFFGGVITNKAAIEVTEASIERALEGSTMQTLQGKVSLPMIQRYVKMLENGLVAPPIKVADGIIVEGNHRYIAGRLFGIEPSQVPYAIPPSQISRAVPIQKTIVDLFDWGGH